LGGGSKASKDYPYQKEPTLFSPAERSFLGVLDQAIGDQFRIMGKVRLADVIKVRPGLEASARQTAFNKIQSKHLDFVACDPADLSIQFAVELDDKSHKQKKRQDRDAFVDAAMNAAGVPIIHFPAQKAYSIQDVRDKIAAQLGEPTGASAVPYPTAEPQRQAVAENTVQYDAPTPPPLPKVPESPAPDTDEGMGLCKSCDSQCMIKWGRYGYYWKCLTCDTNTPIKEFCATCKTKHKLRKDKKRFFIYCEPCNTERLYCEFE
jgi:very-short-patch-repair endonuclease